MSTAFQPAAILSLLLLAAASPARGQALGDRLTLGVGLGLAASHVGINATTRDTAYQGSVQFAARADIGYSISAHVALGIELAYAAHWDAGDCIPGFTVCAPGVSFAGVAGFVAWRPVPKLIIASLGIGPYHLSRAADDARGTALGIIGALETWLFGVGSNTGLSLTLHGILLPDVPGPAITSVALLLGIRSWP